MPFLKMSYLKIKQKDIQVIYIYIYIYITCYQMLPGQCKRQE